MLDTQRRPIESVIRFTAEHGGGTFDPQTLQPLIGLDWGYVVGGREVMDLPVVATPAPDHVLFELKQMAVHARLADCYLGTWTEDGQLSIELSDFYPNRETAFRIAARRGQRYIYSFADMRSIPVSAELESSDNGVGDRDSA